MLSSQPSRRAASSSSAISRWMAKGGLAAWVTRASASGGRKGAMSWAGSSRRMKQRSAWAQAIWWCTSVVAQSLGLGRHHAAASGARAKERELLSTAPHSVRASHQRA